MALAGVVPYDDGIVEAECSGGRLGPDDAAPARRAVADLVSFIGRALETPGRTQPERTVGIS